MAEGSSPPIIPSNEEIIDEITQQVQEANLVDEPESQADSQSDATEKVKKEYDYIDEEKLKLDQEIEALSDEEKEKRRLEAIKFKDEGNDIFKKGDYDQAAKVYTNALRLCPVEFKKERSILYCNRAAAKIQLEKKESALDDCKMSLQLDPEYLRALTRSASLKEQLDDLEGSLADWKLVLERYPDHPEARAAVHRLPPIITEKQEKLKEEMFSKLKDLGNMVLRPFGLSTENFKMVPQEGGGYSVQFEQNK